MNQVMTEQEFIDLAEQVPNFVMMKLAEGKAVSYRSDEYPDLLLREYPNGRLESIDVDINTGERITLAVLREGISA